MWAPQGTLRAPLEPTWPSTGQRSEGGLHRAPGDLMDVSKTWVPGPRACAGDQERNGQRPGSTEVGRKRVREEEESVRRESSARRFRARKTERGESVCRRRERPRGRERLGQLEARQRDTEPPKGWPRDGHLRGGRGSQSQPTGERAEPGGGRRARRASPFDPPRFPLSESAFGDTGTKAVHHITARPGGSLRSRRLIRGERVGPAGREEADSQAGTRGAGKGPACAPASAGARSGVGGGNRYLERR